MLVSVIIPSYNSESYIAECIDSVLQQSYKKIEIICVDNNSNDSTFDIILDYQRKFPDKIKAFLELEKGASVARNKGIKECIGEWIQFLDADDLLLPIKIESQVQIAIESNVDMIVGAYILETNGCKIVSQIPEKDTWIGLIKGQLGYTCSNLFKRSLVLSGSGWENVKSSQEYYFMFSLFKFNPKVKIDEALHTIKKNRNPSSISNIDKSGNWTRFIDLRMLIYEYLKHSKKLNNKHKYLIHQVLLTSIRILYNFDKEKAYIYYNKLINLDFSFRDLSSKNKLYFLFCRLIGFYKTERIMKKFNK